MLQTLKEKWQALRDRLPRLAGWMLAALLMALGVLLIAPYQLPVTLYKLSLITVAALAGYWLDRGLFPYARPHQYLICPWRGEDAPEDTVIRCETPHAVYAEYKTVFAAAMIRRALIVTAAMVAVCLGA